MAFRDSFDKCPRCGVNLEDAGAARGCRSCEGKFVEQPILSEMLLQMLPPPPRAWGTLALSEVKRSSQALPCPSCGDPMKPTAIHDVELDHCPKHGVWFDPDELRVTLYLVADPKRRPPFNEWSPAMELPRASPLPAMSPPPAATASATRPRLVFEVREPEMPPRQVAFEGQTVIKIGKIKSMQLQIANDPLMNRLHAVIEMTGDGLAVYDLGTQHGTYVNEEKITKRVVEPGDFIRCAGTQILIVSVER